MKTCYYCSITGTVVVVVQRSVGEAKSDYYYSYLCYWKHTPLPRLFRSALLTILIPLGFYDEPFRYEHYAINI